MGTILDHQFCIPHWHHPTASPTSTSDGSTIQSLPHLGLLLILTCFQNAIRRISSWTSQFASRTGTRDASNTQFLPQTVFVIVLACFEVTFSWTSSCIRRDANIDQHISCLSQSSWTSPRPATDSPTEEVIAGLSEDGKPLMRMIRDVPVEVHAVLTHTPIPLMFRYLSRATHLYQDIIYEIRHKPLHLQSLQIACNNNHIEKFQCNPLKAIEREKSSSLGPKAWFAPSIRLIYPCLSQSEASLLLLSQPIPAPPTPSIFLQQPHSLPDPLSAILSYPPPHIPYLIPPNPLLYPPKPPGIPPHPWTKPALPFLLPTFSTLTTVRYFTRRLALPSLILPAPRDSPLGFRFYTDRGRKR